jgi:hypothetical protein
MVQHVWLVEQFSRHPAVSEALEQHVLLLFAILQRTSFSLPFFYCVHCVVVP